MKKPDRVEVGQWWRLTYSEMREPVRVESTDIYGTMPVGVFDGWWSSASLIMSKGEYLGSCDHPEPSEWMIEALLAHAKEVAPKAADCYGADTVRHILNGGSTMSMDPRQGDAMNRAVLSLYRILRSLGKW